MSHKAKRRKQVPSMPYWWWLDSDECWFCKNKHNCGNCKYAKKDRKEKIRKQKLKLKDSDINNEVEE